jgi:hypothetical protein
MNKLFLIGILTVIFIAGCTSQDEVPPFPDAPSGNAVAFVEAVQVVNNNGPYSPNQLISLKFCRQDGIYAVYRIPIFQPAGCVNGDASCMRLLNEFTLSNDFPRATTLFTAITSTYPCVEGDIRIPEDAVGSVKFSVAAFKLVNGAWAASETYFQKSLIVAGGGYCTPNYRAATDTQPAVGIRCNGNYLEKCTNNVWVPEECDLGCNPANLRCKDCPTVGETWCDNTKVMTCNANFRNATTTDCSNKLCITENGVNKCGYCVEGNQACQNDTALRTCLNGVWTYEDCDFICSNSACVGAPSN